MDNIHSINGINDNDINNININDNNINDININCRIAENGKNKLPDRWVLMMNLTEKVLIKSLCFLLPILLAVQILLLVPGMGPHLNFALRMEGEPLQEENSIYQAGNIALTPWTSLTLKLVNYKSRTDVEVEVNGQEINSFIKNEITLAVSKGDIITIINPDSKLPVKITVSEKTSNILRPNLNAEVKGVGRLYFAPVVIK
jgi:hypothetical protein